MIRIIRLSLGLRRELSLLFVGESQKRQSGDAGKCRSVATDFPVCVDFLHQKVDEGPSERDARISRHYENPHGRKILIYGGASLQGFMIF